MKYIFRIGFIFVLVFSFCFPGIVTADTAVSFNIDQDTVWTQEYSPYHVTGSVSVSPGVVLRIEPGVTVLFDTGVTSSLSVKGAIDAQGTDTLPVVFRNGEIILEKNAVGTFRHIDSSSASRCIAGEYASLTLEDSVIHDCHQGVGLSGCTFTLHRTVFQRTVHSIATNLLTTFTHTGNTIIDSPLYAAIEMGTVSSSSAILTAGDLPYMLIGSYFAGLETLTIEPGVHVSMADYGQGSVLHLSNGQKIIAHGTPENSIVFDGPSLYADASAAFDLAHVIFTPRPTSVAAITVQGDSTLAADGLRVEGGAAGVMVSDKSSAQIHNGFFSNVDVGVGVVYGSIVTIRNSDFTDTGIGISVVSGGSVTLDTITIERSRKYGIMLGEEQFHDSPNSVTLTGSRVEHNPVGVMLFQGSIIASGNAIESNTIGAEAFGVSDTYDMRSNWWGDTSGPAHQTENPTGKGDVVSPYVLVTPWLGSAPSPDSNTLPGDVPFNGASREPVLLIPGIMGTSLFTQDSANDEVWPAITKLILSPLDSFLDIVSLQSDGTENPEHPLKVGDIIRSTNPPVGPIVDTFNGLIETLTAQGYREGVDLFVFPYDWRYGVFTDAPLLKQKIDAVLEKTGKNTVDIIAHSMGGLVAKAYVSQYGAEKIHNLIFIGTPHVGAPKTIKTLLYGDDMGGHAGPLHILNPERVKSISHNMPSVYELLPSALYDRTAAPLSEYEHSDSTTVLGKAYEDTRLFLARHNFWNHMLELADSTHEQLDELSFGNAHVYNFSGCSAGIASSKTIGGIVVSEHTVYSDIFVPYLAKQYRLLYVNGDETVPLSSAQHVQGSHYYIYNATHGRLPSSPGVPQAIQQIISGVPFTSSNTVDRDVSRCGATGTIVSVHGPVDLHVYDAYSRHTGPTSTGDIEQSIPGVSFDRIDQSTSIFLPDSDTYSVFVRPTGDGVYDAYVSVSDMSDVLTRQAYFSQIRTRDDGGTTRIDYEGIDDSFQASIFEDSFSDGRASQYLAPSAIVSGKAVSDTQAPVTSMSVEGSFVSLSASDEQAGVLRTNYSLNGSRWTEYTQPIEVQGAFVLVYGSIDNAGNTESEKVFTSQVPEVVGESSSSTPELPSIPEAIDFIRGTPPAENGLGGDTALDQKIPELPASDILIMPVTPDYSDPKGAPDLAVFARPVVYVPREQSVVDVRPPMTVDPEILVAHVSNAASYDLEPTVYLGVIVLVIILAVVIRMYWYRSEKQD